MGTLTITYGTTTHELICTGAPSVSYNYNNKSVRLSSKGWSGTKTIGCKGKIFANDITIGRNVNGSAVTTTLKTSGKLANNNIVLKYTPDSTGTVSDPYTYVGSKSYTIPTPYNRAQFFLVGAGAGAAGAWAYHEYEDGEGNSSGENIVGGGGGGYTYTTPILTVTPGQSFTLNIGAGYTFTWNQTIAPTLIQKFTPIQAPSTTLTINGATYTAAGGWTSGVPGTKYSYGTHLQGGNGGSGGGGGNGYFSSSRTVSGCQGGTNGGNGTASVTSAGTAGGTGQGTSTICPFNNITYAGGGGGGSVIRSSAYASASAGAGGSGGGGNGNIYIWKCKPAESHYRAATAGTAGTGGGGGSITITAYDWERTYYLQAPSGGSGVVVAKFWEA